MKPKTIALMAVAIICGLGASYMTSRLLAEREENKPQEVVEVPKVPILVAKKNLDAQLLLKNPGDFFVEKLVAKDDAPPGALSNLALLKGKYLRTGLRTNYHIVAEDLMDGSTTIPIPEGMVALGVKVSIDGGASGFATLPGSRVDIVWLWRRGGDEGTYTKIILQDVMVLAADTKKDNDGNGQAAPANVVTFALNRNDALTLRLASENGPISLFLRKYGDKTTGEATAVTMKDVLTGAYLESDSRNGVDHGGAVRLTKNGGRLTMPGLPPDEVKQEEPKAELKHFYHTVRYSQNGKQWSQKIEIDADGSPILDDVSEDAPAATTPAPAVKTPAPAAQPQAAAATPPPVSLNAGTPPAVKGPTPPTGPTGQSKTTDSK